MKRALVERVFAKALGELDVTARVRAALADRPASPARVVAVGKAAPAMAAGAIDRWGQAIEHCLVVAPDDTDLTALKRAAARARLSDRLVVMRAGHPLPDARSARAGEACLETVASSDRRAIVVLVSGGASALACVPAAGLTLARKRAVTRVMLESGASIQEVNAVRKHLSRIKGGGLLRAAGANEVRTLVVSDVIGGSASDVGSGPSVPDVTTVANARRLLRRFAPSFVELPLVKTRAPPSRAVVTRARATIVVSPEDLSRATATLLREHGLSVRILPPSQAPADRLAAEYVALARRSARAPSRPRAFVRAAEPSVAVSARGGRGGRSTHLAALVGRALGGWRGAEVAHVTFAALASDGVDGRSGTAGAIVDDSFSSRVADQLGELALDRAIARFDTGPLHRAMRTAVVSRPTGQNLADLHVLVVE